MLACFATRNYTWYMLSKYGKLFKVMPTTILADISTKDNLRFLARNFFDIEILKNFTSISLMTIKNSKVDNQQIKINVSEFLKSKIFFPDRFLTYDPTRRRTAEESLKHKFFSESPLPIDPSMFPTWPAKSEQPRKHTSSPKPPSGGKAYSKLLVR